MTHDTMNDSSHRTKSRGKAGAQDPNKSDKAGRTKIFYFTSSGNLERVKELVQRGADVNHKDHAGWTPLHEAAIKGQYPVAAYLIQQGAMVNARGFEDDTPLHDACSYGFFDCVQLLVDSGANVYALNSEKQTPLDVCDDEKCIAVMKLKIDALEKLALADDQGRTRLHRASAAGDVATVERVLAEGDNVNASDINQSTPLHYAAQHGHQAVVEALIRHGADIHSLDRHQSTVLHTACQHSHPLIAEFLIQAGASVHALDKDGQTPYAVTSLVEIRQMITALIDEEKRQRATTEAIDEITFVSNTKQKRSLKTSREDSTGLSREERKIQAIMRSFEKAEKSQQAKKPKREKTVNKKQKTPISRDGSLEPTASKKKPSSSSSLPLSSAVTHTSPQLVDISKLDPHKKDTSGRTLLFKYAARGHLQAVQGLITAGADPSLPDNASYTPLHEAALAGKTDVVRLLLQNNAQVNAKGADLDTPLHDAAENGHLEIIQLLLDYGASPSIQNAQGFTPLDIATQQQHQDIVHILHQHKPPKQKKRRLVLAANMPCKQPSPHSPLSPVASPHPENLKDAKAHARQLSGQHLPKKSLKNLQVVKTEVLFDGYPQQPLIPTPPPDHWSRAIKKEEDALPPQPSSPELYQKHPSLHRASRFLPLYTIQQSENQHSSGFYVADLQVALLLGISTGQIFQLYPHLLRKKVSSKEKERLWSPLSPMICTPLLTDKDPKERKEAERSKFISKDIYFIRLDQVVSIIKNDYSHLSEILITITLDIGYQPSTKLDLAQQKINHVKLPPKFAMKMRKCGMLNNNKSNHRNNTS